MPLEKSAGAIIFYRGNPIEYLLLHYPSGSRTKKDYWDLPKGHIEKDEEEEDTVRREVREETGLDNIKIIEGFKESIKYFFKSAPYQSKHGTGQEVKTIFKTVVFYLAETKTKKVKISFEHIGYQWLPYEKALGQLKFKNAKDILKKANKYLIPNT